MRPVDPAARTPLLRPRRAFFLTLAVGLALVPNRPAGPRWPGGWINPLDGQEYVTIPAGTFWMGCVPGDTTCDEDELPRRRVTISRPFRMARTETTVRVFRRFVEETGYRPASERTGSGWGQGERDLAWVKGLSWKTPLRVGERAPGDWPVTQVSWGDALAFCRWAGGTLPTEAQAEYVRHRSADWVYPWGPVVDWAVDENLADEEQRAAAGGWAFYRGYDDGFAEIAPVGSYPPDARGLHDLAGNVTEWCLDWYGAAWYSEAPAVDPGGPASGRVRCIRGGSFRTSPNDPRVSARGWNPSGGRYLDVGFRCVLPVSAEE